jgi:hypothetical protein
MLRLAHQLPTFDPAHPPPQINFLAANGQPAAGSCAADAELAATAGNITGAAGNGTAAAANLTAVACTVPALPGGRYMLQIASSSGELGVGIAGGATFAYTGAVTGVEGWVGPSSGGEPLVLTASGSVFNTRNLAANQVGAGG